MEVLMRGLALMVLCTVVACGDDDGDSVPPAREDTVATCSDGRDNDSDGLIDCADPGCGVLATCVSTDAGPDPLDGGPPPQDLGPTGCSVRIDASGLEFTDSCSGANLCVCSVDTTCNANCNLCLSPGTCEPAFPRRYRLAPVFAYVPATKPSGEGWDADGSGPDLYAAMMVDGAGRFETATANDLPLDGDGDFTAVYSGSFGDFNMVSGSSIFTEVFDEDAVADDGAFECNWSANPSLARARFLECAGDELGGFGAFMLPL